MMTTLGDPPASNLGTQDGEVLNCRYGLERSIGDVECARLVYMIALWALLSMSLRSPRWLAIPHAQTFCARCSTAAR
jgi:hypothetical protein